MRVKRRIARRWFAFLTSEPVNSYHKQSGASSPRAKGECVFFCCERANDILLVQVGTFVKTTDLVLEYRSVLILS